MRHTNDEVAAISHGAQRAHELIQSRLTAEHAQVRNNNSGGGGSGGGGGGGLVLLPPPLPQPQHAAFAVPAVRPPRTSSGAEHPTLPLRTASTAPLSSNSSLGRPGSGNRNVGASPSRSPFFAQTPASASPARFGVPQSPYALGQLVPQSPAAASWNVAVPARTSAAQSPAAASLGRR